MKMKKTLIMLTLVMLTAGILPAQVRQGSTQYVTAKSIDLKTSTGFFAGKAGKVSYGEQVKVLAVNGKWAQIQSVSNSSLKGWISVSNLTSKRITGGGGSASASEIALAGKGFNQEVENAYKAEGNLNYADVDRTEAVTVPETELLIFLEEGHLAKGDQ
jgi:uncharacterized protein YgiM (DUF1202 family)